MTGCFYCVGGWWRGEGGVLSPWPMSEVGGGVGVGLGMGQLLRFPGAMSAALFWVVLFCSDG